LEHRISELMKIARPKRLQYNSGDLAFQTVSGANTGRKITLLRNLSEEEFREHLRRSNDPARRYIVNFSRERIFGAGVGHHSPIGGYLENEDLVFILDVNSDFQPWLVERTRLFAAVDTLDGDKKRGLLLIE
jgi:hypothetical protein